MRSFADRSDAGRQLAEKLVPLDLDDPYVLALPRGGVPVAAEIASTFDAPLDVFLVRKLGVPGREELAFGAVAEGNFRVLNHDIVEGMGISRNDIERVTDLEYRELRRRATAYRGNRPSPDLSGHTVIIVDDGLATGATMRVATQAVFAQEPRRLIVAVPVAPPDASRVLGALADAIVTVYCPVDLGSVGAWYDDFTQTTDSEVKTLLARFNQPVPTHRT